MQEKGCCSSYGLAQAVARDPLCAYDKRLLLLLGCVESAGAQHLAGDPMPAQALQALLAPTQHRSCEKPLCGAGRPAGRACVQAMLVQQLWVDWPAHCVGPTCAKPKTANTCTRISRSCPLQPHGRCKRTESTPRDLQHVHGSSDCMLTGALSQQGYRLKRVAHQS